MVPAQIARRFFEYVPAGSSTEARYIHELVMSFEHRKMQLRNQHVRIVSRIADNRDAIRVPLHVGSAGAEQELRGIVALVQKWMTGRSVAVQTFKVDLRGACVAQFRCVGVAAQNRSIGRNIVSHKLAEDRPSRCGIA